MRGHLCRSMEWRKELERSPRDFFGWILWAEQLISVLPKVQTVSSMWQLQSIVQSLLLRVFDLTVHFHLHESPQIPRLSAFCIFKAHIISFVGFPPLQNKRVKCANNQSADVVLLQFKKRSPLGGHWIPAQDSKPSVREQYKGGASSIPPIQRRRPTVRIFPSYILALSSLKAAREKSPHRSDVIYWM